MLFRSEFVRHLRAFYHENNFIEIETPVLGNAASGAAAKPFGTHHNDFDEDFFLYGEDEDLAWRIREKGFSIGYIEEAIVFHWGGQSETGTTPAALFEKKIKAEYLFYEKHYRTDTIERIKRTERFKAIFRIWTLKISLPFSAKKTLIQNKIDRYRLIYKMTTP